MSLIQIHLFHSIFQMLSLFHSQLLSSSAINVPLLDRTPDRDGQKLIALQLIAIIALQLSNCKGRNIAIINCNGRN